MNAVAGTAAHPSCTTGHGVPVVLRLLPPAVFPSRECTELCSLPKRRGVSARRSNASGPRLPGERKCEVVDASLLALLLLQLYRLAEVRFNGGWCLAVCWGKNGQRGKPFITKSFLANDSPADSNPETHGAYPSCSLKLPRPCHISCLHCPVLVQSYISPRPSPMHPAPSHFLRYDSASLTPAITVLHNRESAPSFGPCCRGRCYPTGQRRVTCSCLRSWVCGCCTRGEAPPPGVAAATSLWRRRAGTFTRRARRCQGRLCAA